MIHIVDSASEPGDTVLRGMFEARKAVFVDLLRWDVPVVNGRFEIDQFDDERAVYIVLTDDAGHHMGSARLLETVRPHILDTLFPELCEGAPPTGPQVREITRFCLDRQLRSAERLHVRNQLVTALAEHALAHGITTYTGVAGLGWYQQILAFGWRCVPLGLPKSHRGTPLAALAIEIDDDTPKLLAEAGVYARPAHTELSRARAA